MIVNRLDAPARELISVTADAPGDVPTAGTVSAALADLVRTERAPLLLLQEYWAQATRDEQLAVRYRARQAALRDTLASALKARHEHTGVPLTFDAHHLAHAFIALAQGLALESIVDPDAGNAALFGDILSLVYDGLAARAAAAPQ